MRLALGRSWLWEPWAPGSSRAGGEGGSAAGERPRIWIHWTLFADLMPAKALNTKIISSAMQTSKIRKNAEFYYLQWRRNAPNYWWAEIRGRPSFVSTESAVPTSGDLLTSWENKTCRIYCTSPQTHPGATPKLPIPPPPCAPGPEGGCLMCLWL